MTLAFSLRDHGPKYTDRPAASLISRTLDDPSSRRRAWEHAAKMRAYGDVRCQTTRKDERQLYDHTKAVDVGSD